MTYSSSTTYTRDGMYISTATNSDIRTWRTYGNITDNIGICGLSALSTNTGIIGIIWYFATYIRDAIYMYDNTISIREWSSYGDFGYNSGPAGLSLIQSNAWVGHSTNYFATRDAMYSVTEMIYPTALICYGVLHILNDKGGISYIYCAIGFTHEAWGFATTYTRYGMYMAEHGTISERQWSSYGTLTYIGIAGLMTEEYANGIANIRWFFATI